MLMCVDACALENEAKRSKCSDRSRWRVETHADGGEVKE